MCRRDRYVGKTDALRYGGQIGKKVSGFLSIDPKIALEIQFSDDLKDLFIKGIDFAFRLGKQYNNMTLEATFLLETKLIGR